MMKIHTLPMGPVQANCYVVIDEHSGEAAVIDPGDYTDELKAVLRDEVKNLKYILLTHGHYYHILGVAHIKDDYPMTAPASSARISALRSMSITASRNMSITTCSRKRALKRR